MKSLYAALCLFPLCVSADESAKTFKESPVAVEDATLKLAKEDYKFTEGPAVDASGNIYFTDQPNDRILLWDAKTKEVSTFLQPCGRSNGLFVDPDGILLACADEANELWAIDVKTKKHKVLVATYQGKRLNGPNDVWPHPNGGLYFTDPFYKRPYWKHEKSEQDGQHVYYLPKGANEAIRVTEDLVQPNGIIGDAKQSLLYVADIGDKKTYAYRFQSDGSLTNRTLLIEMGSDGMTLDDQGNLYLTGKGVTVVNPKGEKIEHIPVPEGWTANVCFGGTDGKTLFITAMDSVYTLAMKVAGLGFQKASP